MKEQKSFPDFLRDTNWRPLIIIASGLEFFGSRIVISFLLGSLLGGSAIYAYSQIPSLPFYKLLFSGTATQLPKPEEITISGQVNDWQEHPIQQATAYLVPRYEAERFLKPVINGKVDFKVPKGRYVVFVATSSHSTYTEISETAKTPYFNIKIPPEAANLQGKVIDENKRLKKDIFVCIHGGQLPEERCTKTDKDGNYTFTAIPIDLRVLGFFTIKEQKSGQEVQILLQDIQSYKSNTAPTIELSKEVDPVVMGTVKDRIGRPVPNIWVSIDGKYGILTAYNGRFTISVPSSGTHIIEVRQGNRIYYRKSININTNPFSYDIQLP
jgi:hypothetical protein